MAELNDPIITIEDPINPAAAQIEAKLKEYLATLQPDELQFLATSNVVSLTLIAEEMARRQGIADPRVKILAVVDKPESIAPVPPEEQN